MIETVLVSLLAVAIVVAGILLRDQPPPSGAGIMRCLKWVASLFIVIEHTEEESPGFTPAHGLFLPDGRPVVRPPGNPVPVKLPEIPGPAELIPDEVVSEIGCRKIQWDKSDVPATGEEHL